MSETKRSYRSPFLWVPSSYLAMGLIYSLVGAVANIMFFNLGMNTAQAAFWSSCLGWPYVFKLFWAPGVELYKTKKFFVLSTQLILVGLVICVGCALTLPRTEVELPPEEKPKLTEEQIAEQAEEKAEDEAEAAERAAAGEPLPAKEPEKKKDAPRTLTVVHVFGLSLPVMVPVIVLLALAALVGATQDIASDGVYVTTLGPAEQAKYCGIQSMCWNAGPILASGVLLRVSGMLHDAPETWGRSWNVERQTWEISWIVEHFWRPVLSPIAAAAQTTGDWGRSWMVVMFTIAGLIGALLLYHSRFLPPGEKAHDAPKNIKDAMRTFGHAFTSFFEKKGILLMIAFAFFFRFGYGFLEKVGPLFMEARRSKGGLHLSNQVVGDIIGTYGAAAFMLGSILGGLFVAKVGLRRTLLLLCLCMNVPNIVYVYFSQTMTRDYWTIASLVSIEKFFWGFGAVGLMIYFMQQLSPGPYRTAHLTFGSAIMGFNMIFTGMISGGIATFFGYKTFFIVVLIGASIPSVIATLLAPFHQPDTAGPGAAERPPEEPAVAVS